MHHSINGPAGMTPDAAMAQGNGGYGGAADGGWASLSPYSQSPYSNSPMNEYANWGSYIPQPPTLPSESLGGGGLRMQAPGPQTHQHQLIQPAPSTPRMGSGHHHHHHHQLPMLNTAWPSQLTNPTPAASYSAPPLSLTPVSAARTLGSPRPLASLPTGHIATPALHQAPPPPPTEKSRKTLSTEQKRAMCIYFEENPGTRQADIGAKFGVERSTVSKVLRQKDLLLKRDQDPEHMSAAMKRAAAKGKNPDFDRTLSNYVRKQQQNGHEVKDEDIMDQAKLFARASGSGTQQDGLLNSLTTSWLQKFKQKHGLGTPSSSGSGNGNSNGNSGSGSGSGGSGSGSGGGRLIRRASEANIPDSARMSTVRRPSIKKSKQRKNAVLAPKTEVPVPPLPTGLGIGIISPTSPTGGHISPLSATRSDGEIDDPFDLRHFGSYRTTTASQSAHDLTAAASSFSGAEGTISPAGTLAFSPDPSSTGAFASLDPPGTIDPRSTEFQQLHREKRSNTFPSLNIDAATTAASTIARTTTDSPLSSLSQHNQQHALGTSSNTTLESPDQDLSSNPFALDTTLGSPPQLRRTGSSSSILTASGTPAPNSAVTASSVAASASLESLSSMISSPPVSPSQEDARRAANTLLSYIKSVNSHAAAFGGGMPGQQFEHGEYMALVHLTKKLQVHQMQQQAQQQQQQQAQQQQQQQQQQQPVHQIQHRPSMGGLSRIPEGDTEMMQAPEMLMETS